jgi:hypothetical protein
MVISLARMSRELESSRPSQHNAVADALLTLPIKKTAFDYNISTPLFAALDSIAAVAKCHCCSAFGRRGATIAPIGIRNACSR